jgi:hypothetical protein
VASLDVVLIHITDGKKQIQTELAQTKPHNQCFGSQLRLDEGVKIQEAKTGPKKEKQEETSCTLSEVREEGFFL